MGYDYGEFDAYLANNIKKRNTGALRRSHDPYHVCFEEGFYDGYEDALHDHLDLKKKQMATGRRAKLSAMKKSTGNAARSLHKRIQGLRVNDKLKNIVRILRNNKK